jgi:ACR3 family arsenite efflux pump ArsB
MQHEYTSLIDNGTWKFIDRHVDQVVVNNMWIYKIKSGIEGEVYRCNARFVAKGCSQRAGLNYTETSPLVIRMASFRLFLAIATAMDL